jgi:hypothetical protein
MQRENLFHTNTVRDLANGHSRTGFFTMTNAKYSAFEDLDTFFVFTFRIGFFDFLVEEVDVGPT